MRQCAICKKGSKMVGHRILLRGHYNPTGTSRKYPNLQYATVGGTRKLVCTSCLRKMSKTAKPKKSVVAAKKRAAAAAAA